MTNSAPSDRDDDEKGETCDYPFMLRVRMDAEMKKRLDQAHEDSKYISPTGKKVSRSKIARDALKAACNTIIAKAKKVKDA